MSPDVPTSTGCFSGSKKEKHGLERNQSSTHISSHQSNGDGTPKLKSPSACYVSPEKEEAVNALRYAGSSLSQENETAPTPVYSPRPGSKDASRGSRELQSLDSLSNVPGSSHSMNTASTILLPSADSKSAATDSSSNASGQPTRLQHCCESHDGTISISDSDDEITDYHRSRPESEEIHRRQESQPAIEIPRTSIHETSEIAECQNSGVELCDSAADSFLDKMFEENRIVVSQSPTTSTDTQGGSNTSYSATTPRSSLTSTTDGTPGKGNPNKRKQREDDDDEENTPNRRRKEQTGPIERLGQQGSRTPRLACHFHLFDKRQYCKNNRTGKKYETFSGPGWKSMHYLK